MDLFTNIILAIQNAMKINKIYTAPIDGKYGIDTQNAMVKWIRSYNVNPDGWNAKRIRLAAEQLLYKEAKIDVGIVDGKYGPMLEHAREVWQAKQVISGRDTLEELAPVLKETGVIKTTTVKVTPVRKWPTQKEVPSFFGKVGSNQVDAVMPYPLRIAWETKTKVNKFSVHKLVKEPVERVFNRTLDYYGYEKIKELGLDLWGGALNVRKKRGGSTYSMHAWGIAVDIDPDHNGFKTSWKNARMSGAEYKPFVKFWYEEGAINLGIEANMDPMHFQFARLR